MTDVISVTVVDEEDVVPGTGAAVGGARWYSAAGVPSPAVGNPNDFYLDSETGLYYEKVGSDWENRGDLRSGDVTGPASSTTDRLVIFANNSGKLLADSGIASDSVALVGHTHSIANVTGLQTALDGKASSSHTHIIANVTGLQTALDGKASLSHTHTISDVTGLQTALDGKAVSFATIAAASAANIPGPQVAVTLRGAVTDGIGGATYYSVANSGPLTGGQFQSNGGTRRWQIEPARAADILCHGAATDGTADCSEAFAKAFQACGKAYVPPGIFVANVVLPSGCAIEGADKFLSVIRSQAGADRTVVAGFNAYSLFGSGSFDTNAGCNNATIRDVTIDGNRANVSLSGDGIAIWGYATQIRNVRIMNCRSNGLRTEWTDGNIPMEGIFSDILIDTVGGHGWLMNGPHDSDARNIIIIDASQNADNGFRGLFVQGSAGGVANGRFYNVHVWHRSGISNRCQFALWSNGYNEFTACHFEGARSIASTGLQDRYVNCLFYAPFGANGAAIVNLNGNIAQFVGCEFRNGTNNAAYSSTLTNSNSYAINFNSVSGCVISSCYFNGFSVYSPFNFATSAGLNVVQGCFGYCPAGGATTFGGAVNAGDAIEYVQGGTVINYRRPAAYPAAANDAGAAAAGVPVGGWYELTATRALTKRAT